MMGRKLSQNYSTDVCELVPRPTSLSFKDIFERKESDWVHTWSPILCSEPVKINV